MFEYNNLRFAQEGIFSGISPLAADLIKTFTKQKETIDEYVEQSNAKSYLRLYNNTFDKFAHKFETELSKCISKHIGMTIDVRFPKVSPQCQFGLCIYYWHGDIETNYANMVEGAFGMSECKGEDKDIERLSRILNSFDDTEKTFKEYTKLLPQKERKEINAEIEASFQDMYMAEYAFGESKEYDIYMTPEECAAIFLHEIGHFVNATANIGRIIAVSKVMGETKSVIGTHIKNKEPLKALDDVSARIKFLQNSAPKMKNNNILKKAEACTNILKKSYNEAKDTSGVSLVVIDAFLDIIITVLVGALWISISGCVALVFLGVEVTGTLFGFDEFSFKSKTSDLMTTSHNRKANEFAADAFAAQHGLGAANATALKKYDTLSALYEGHKLVNDPKAVKENDFIKMIILFNAKLFELCTIPVKYNIDGHEHGEYEERLRATSQSIVASYKKINNPDIEKKFVQDYEKVMALLDESKKIFRNRESIGNWFMYFPKYLNAFLIKGFNIFGEKNVRLFMEKNISKIKDFIDNTMFYQSAKLSQLSKRK